ncbi:MAG TPA: MoaD/ThiS family protein [Planctomycetota bacterium]|nr:MoaD/ThiS family protein [Planctomycetota bacterium]
MNIAFKYFAQVRQAAGAESEQIELPDGANLADALAGAAARHGPDFRKLVLDEFGVVRPSMLVLVNGVPAARGGLRKLAEGDEVTLLSAVSGG